MNLKDEFRQQLTGHLSDEKTQVDVEIATRIAEEFACAFTEWFWYHGTKYWRGERRDYLSMKEILKIYKEENND